jgi:TRAP-type C4-dicarboxylate transport system substrate-binding protein
VQQSDLWVSLLSAMGAAATPMPYSEVYGGLRAGAIDGAENNWPSYDSAKHFEVAKNYTLTEHSMAPEVLMMSKIVWDKLSPEEQKAIRESAKESVPYMRKLWDDREARAKIAVISRGARVYEVDKKSFQDAMRPVYDKFITDPKMKDMIKRIQETQ